MQRSTGHAAPDEPRLAAEPQPPPPATTRQLIYPSLTELATAAFLFTLSAAVLFFPHIQQGGLYSDDWESVSLAHFDTHGLLHLLLPGWTNPGNRPLHNIDYSLVLALLGYHQHAYPAYTALLTAAVSLALYATLRTLSMERLHAAMIAGLVLVYPYADSTHLWFSATDSDETIVLYLLGVIMAIRGLHTYGRSAIVCHATAVALFACSIMLYESTASVIMLTGLLYWWLAGRRAALPRWSIDVGSTLLLLSLFASNSTIPRTHGISALAQHTRIIYNQALTLMARSVLPLNVDRSLVLIAIALVLVSGFIAWWYIPAASPTRAWLRRWLLIAVGGLLFTVASMAMFIPSAVYYVPLQEGVGNRVNAVPALGIAAATYSVYMILGALVAYALKMTRPTIPRAARFNILYPGVAFALILAILTASRWAHLTRTDISAWDLASRYQLQMLDRIHILAPRPAHHDILLVFGSPAYTEPGVPVFAASWDLNGAIQRSYNDFTLAADPIIQGSSVTCTAVGIASSVGQGPSSTFPYGYVILLDPTTHSVSRPTRMRQCHKVLHHFTPGPLTLLSPSES
jgi:hypothetical protein